jgi:hypothetical protein
MNYSKAILGDNQFLGVNHSNQAKAADLFERFKNPEPILEVIGTAYSAGVRDFMFTVHDRYSPVFDEIRRSNMFPGMFYTPCIPYAHKYWNKLSEVGFARLLASIVGQTRIKDALLAVLRLGKGDLSGLIECFISIEVQMCEGLPLRGVFLQNLAFDLLMALELYNVIEKLYDTVGKGLDCRLGFITMNHSMAVDVLCTKIGLQRPWLCSNYNISGFRMHPSQAVSELSFGRRLTNNIAMSVFASSLQSPRESLEYVVSKMAVGDIQAVLFGSSNPKNLRENVKIICG